MLKYVDSIVTFTEIPDEITLCINISGCQIRCPDCHSKYLWEDVGKSLTGEVLEELINKNEGITCVCLMGGDHEPYEVYELFKHIALQFPWLLLAWYSGLDKTISYILSLVDYYKVGHYDKNLGGLDKKTTNQRLFMINHNNRFVEDMENYKVDITSLMCKNNETDN